MTDKVSGGCLCGKIRFETDATPAFQLLCHCTDCQTVSGAPYYTAYVVPIDGVTLLSGEPNGYTVKSDQGRDNRRMFCPDCGSRLWAELEIGMASVNGMALDDRTHFQPSANHRLVTKPDWCAVNDALPER